MTPADSFRPEQWSNFFLLVGTGAVTLTGLVFVAMSLNLGEIASDATHRNRAINTLTGLALVFLSWRWSMGGQGYKAIGAVVPRLRYLGCRVRHRLRQGRDAE